MNCLAKIPCLPFDIDIISVSEINKTRTSEHTNLLPLVQESTLFLNFDIIFRIEDNLRIAISRILVKLSVFSDEIV